MKLLLQISRRIDAMTERVGRTIYWLVLIAVLVSSVNASVRKVFDMSSNAFLELQWYLFSAIFLLGAGYALLKQEHVRIDVIYGRFPKRVQIWIDILGTLLFLMPMALLILWHSWPVFVNALLSNEQSSSAGGLTVWPVRLLLPAGFALLIVQAVSELIKRFAFLKGLIADPREKQQRMTPEEELAAEIKARAAGAQP
jgi:TRAP-type mannitol/chloroaromatic compound transport system permease small subunit